MKLINKKIKAPGGILNSLDEVLLSKRRQDMLDEVTKTMQGPHFWKARKQEEARELLALEQISQGRFEVKEIDAAESLRAIILMKVPVPLRPDNDEKLKLAEEVILGLTYRKEAVILPQPGFSFVQIFSPNNLWHANIGGPEHGQPLCLGLRLPAAIQIKDILLMTYGALSMQTIMINEMDQAGVLNPNAAKFWQQNMDKIPLTSEPFIRKYHSQTETG
jgi:hypothetical protein